MLKLSIISERERERKGKGEIDIRTEREAMMGIEETFDLRFCNSYIN